MDWTLFTPKLRTHQVCVQEHAKHGFLNTLLAHGVPTGLLLGNTSACIHSRERLGAKCQSSASLAPSFFLSQLHSDLWKTRCHIIPAEHKLLLLINVFFMVTFQTVSSPLYWKRRYSTTPLPNVWLVKVQMLSMCIHLLRLLYKACKLT